MATLINDVEDLKRHIVVSSTFDFKKVLPFAKRAERKIILGLIGRDQYDTIVLHHFIPDNDTPINLVRELFEEAVANLSLILALPTIDLLITNSGTKKVEGSESSNADWRDKLDLKRSLMKTFTEALDDAFLIMEENVDQFSEWRDSNYYTVFTDALVRHTKTFNDNFSIKNNRATFLALKPYMDEVEDQYLLSMVGACTLDMLKKQTPDSIITSAQVLAQKALVALTVAKVADTGMFAFTETSFTIVYDEVPWEKSKLELDAEKLERLRKARQTAGEEYLKRLKKILVANPTIFHCYVDKIETGITQKLIIKKSGLTL